MPHVRLLVATVWVLSTVSAVSPTAVATTRDATEAIDAIDATGNSDVTADLQALFDRTPDGGVVQLQAGADYRVEGTLVIKDRRDLRIEGNGARIFATTTAHRTRYHLRLVGGSDLVVRNLEVQGANPHAGDDDRGYVPELEAQHGISLDGVTDVELVGVYVHDTYGDLVYVGMHPDDSRWSQGVWVHDSVFARSGRQGIAVVAARDVVIEHNVLTDMRRATIDLEPSAASWGAENIHILENDVGPGRLLFVAAGGNGPVNWVVVARNTLQGRGLSVHVVPPEGARRQRFWVVDNTSDLVAVKQPLQFTRTDGVVVHGNRQPVDERYALVESTDSCDVAITENDIAPGARLMEGRSRQCNFDLPVEPPEPPPIAGRDAPTPPPATTAPTTAPTTATTTTTAPPTIPPTSAAPTQTTTPPAGTQLTASATRGGDGVAGPVVVLAMVLAALAGTGGALAFNAWRGRR
jgi:hypothetical protein